MWIRYLLAFLDENSYGSDIGYSCSQKWLAAESAASQSCKIQFHNPACRIRLGDKSQKIKSRPVTSSHIAASQPNFWSHGRLLITDRWSGWLLTLFIEVEVLEALVEVAGSVYSSDVGVGVDGPQARDGRAVSHGGLVSLLWRKTQRGQTTCYISGRTWGVTFSHLTSLLCSKSDVDYLQCWLVTGPYSSSLPR